MISFDTAFDRVLGHEGGYVNDANDPGGETHWGVTWPKLREAIGAKILPPGTTIRNLTRDQSKLIYKELFWDLINGDQLHDGVAFQVFDFAVNSGIETAIRYLQRALGVADDGRWGPISQAAANAMSETDTLFRLNGERLDFYTRLSTWSVFGKGWARRIAGNLRYAAEDS